MANRGRGRKALTIIFGTLAMAAIVVVIFAVLSKFAGGWGVPYFSFTSSHGSPCKNTFTGYVCSPLTATDVGYYGDVTLPAGTTVVDGTYTVTGNYALQATVTMPERHASRGLTALKRAYGKCQEHPTSLDTSELHAVCVMANDNYTAQEDGEQASAIYVVGTGLRKDGSRIVTISIRSR